MAKPDDLDDDAEDDLEEQDAPEVKKKRDRDDDISGKKKIREKLLDVFDDVSKAFDSQSERTNQTIDNWDMMNCVLTSRQAYAGNSKIFIPLIRDAVEARVTRFVNQLFPESNRSVDAVTENGDIPFSEIAILEHYVRTCKLRTEVIPAMIRNGDVEGQWSLYVDWSETKRTVVKRDVQPLEVDGVEVPAMGDIETVVEEEIKDAFPNVEVISDPDLVVLPVTADSIPKALAIGGSVTVRRRWTKAKIKQMAKEGHITKRSADDLVESMTSPDRPGRKNVIKKQAEAAGIKGTDGSKHVAVYETWLRLEVEGEWRLCRAYYAGDEVVLGCKVNPYWNDRCPVISAPVRKANGLFKGRAPVSDVIDLQCAANDQINMGYDTAMFSAMPIIMTDPVKNPRTDSMILGLAALWECSPESTKFAQFPALWKDSLEIVAATKQQIFQTLGVNPAMIPQSSGAKGGKRNQAEVAMEQQVDMLTTADVVTGIQESILDELLLRFAEYDHQFRDKKMAVQAYGPMGMRANMESVEPVRLNHGVTFRWQGVEVARNAAQRQNQIAWMNVLKSIPPQLLPGHKLDLAPIAEAITLGVLGPRLAPITFIDEAKQGAIEAEQENEMLAVGFDLMPHPPDDDPKHMQIHMKAMQGSGDPHGTFKAHIQRHQMQMQAKAMAKAQQQQPKGLPGAPGGAGPGVPGAPKPGSQPQQPRPMRGPAGAINPDQMARAGAPGMPRRA